VQSALVSAQQQGQRRVLAWEWQPAQRGLVRLLRWREVPQEALPEQKLEDSNSWRQHCA
jgi:hypothetical protein